MALRYVNHLSPKPPPRREASASGKRVNADVVGWGILLMVKVMIVSGMQDVHAQAVMSALAERGDATVELLDLSEFPMRLSLTMAFEEGCRRFLLRRHGENGGRSTCPKSAQSGGVGRSRMACRTL